MDTPEPQLSHQVTRLRDRVLLDAAMATSALVAMGDRRILIEENLMLAAVLENVELLKIHDPELAVSLHSRYVEEMRRDYELGKRAALQTISRCADDLEAAELCVKIGIAIAKADLDFSPEEIAVVEEICSHLEISGLDLSELSRPGKSGRGSRPN